MLKLSKTNNTTRVGGFISCAPGGRVEMLLSGSDAHKQSVGGVNIHLPPSVLKEKKSCKIAAATGEVRRSEKMKLLSSRKATVQPEAPLFFSSKTRDCGLAHPVFHTLGSATCHVHANSL